VPFAAAMMTYGTRSPSCGALPGSRLRMLHTDRTIPVSVQIRTVKLILMELIGTATAHTFPTTHAFNGPFSGTTKVSRYQKGKINLDFTEARDSEWQWHQLGHMQVCISLQTDNHAITLLLSFLQAGCPSCCPTNSVKALKEYLPHNAVKLAQRCYQ